MSVCVSYNIGVYMTMPTKKDGRYSQRQAKFIKYYTSPTSETYDNARASAIKAGYSKGYASGLAYKRLVPLAEAALDDIPTTKEKIDQHAAFYDDMLRSAEKGIYKRIKADMQNDPKMTAIQQKDQHFVAETIGRDRYSRRKEVHNTGFTDVTENSLLSLANSLERIARGQKPPVKADYEVIDDEIERIENEKQGE